MRRSVLALLMLVLALSSVTTFAEKAKKASKKAEDPHECEGESLKFHSDRGASWRTARLLFEAWKN